MSSPERRLRIEDLEGRQMMSTVSPVGDLQTETAGALQGAIDLERGSAQFLSIPDASQKGLDLAGDYTVECRFRMESAPGTDEYRPFLSKWTGGASAGRAYAFGYINLGGTNKIYVNRSADGTNVASKTLDYTFQPGVWYDIAFSFRASAGTADVFVNGEKIGSMTGFPQTIKDSAADAALGNFLDETFDGQIDEMRVWAVTRSGEEIAANRRMDLQGDEAGLVSDWRFNDNALTDAALSGNTFVNRGGAVFSSDVPAVQARAQATAAPQSLASDVAGAVDAVMEEIPQEDAAPVILPVLRSVSEGGSPDEGASQDTPLENVTLPVLRSASEGGSSTKGDIVGVSSQQESSESLETPIAPSLKVAEIHGNTVLVSVASPQESSTVVIGGAGGILQQSTLSHPGGTELAMAKVTMNRVTPPGRYPLALFGPSSSQAITSLEIDWNGTTLSLVTDESQWDAVSQAEMTAGRGMTGVEQLKGDLATAQAAVNVFEKQMALTTTNLDGFPELKRLQAADLYERCNPKWKIETWEIRALVNARYPYADATTQKLTADALESQMYAYYDGVGEVLHAAMEVYRSVEHGGDQDVLLEGLRATITRVSTLRYVTEIMVGIGRQFPTDEQAILADALRLYSEENTLNMLAYKQAEQDRFSGISTIRSDDPAFQIKVLGQTPAPDVLYASASNGYQGYLDESQQRRLATIVEKTQNTLLVATDVHARLVLAVAGQYNAQREYAIAMANGTSAGTTVATTQQETVAAGSGAVKTGPQLLALAEWVGEVGGIAYNNEEASLYNLSSNYVFGEEITRQLASIGGLEDSLARISEANTVTGSVVQTTDNKIDLTNQTFSFIVSRPIIGMGEYVAYHQSHNFIVVGARFLGDPNAEIYSYGKNDMGDGFVGRVTGQTLNDFSSETAATDRDYWLSIRSTCQKFPVEAQLIPAPDNTVRLFANALIENQDYAALAGILGSNSNSAAQAVANAAAGMEIPLPPTDRESTGADNYYLIQFEYE